MTNTQFQPFSRRTFMKGGLVGIATASGVGALASCSTDATTASNGARLTYSSYGGTTEVACQDAWGKPFIEQEGVAIDWVSPTDLGKLRAMVETKTVSWDLVQAEITTAFTAGAEDMYEPVSQSGLDPSTLIEGSAYALGFPAYGISFCIAYRTDAMRDGRGPKTWAEFYDVQQFPGTRAFDQQASRTLESALIADGVSREDLYPLDVDRALAKMESIREHIVWYETGAQQQQQLQSGTADFCCAWNGRIFELIQNDVEVEMELNEQLFYIAYNVVPIGAPNRDVAMRFGAFITQAAPQLEFARMTGYGPINAEAAANVPADLAPYLPTTPQNLENAVRISADYWRDNRQEVQSRFDEWRIS